jgi:long-chain acyl-CoA synthetase
MTVGGVGGVGIWAHAAVHPERPAFVEAGGRQVAAATLVAEANAIAHGWRSIGLQPGDTIAAVLGNRVELMTTYLAAIQAGLYFTPVNFHLTVDEIAYVLANSDSRVVVTEARFAALVGAACDGLPLARYSVDPVAGFAELNALTAGQPRSSIEDAPLGDVMVYTSGTTGRPKGVRRDLGKGDVLATLELFADIVVGGRGDGIRPHLVSCPLYHRGPFISAAVALHVGHPLIVMDRWTPDGWVRLAAEHRVASAYVVPTMIHRLMQRPAEVREAEDLSALEYVLHSAAPVSPVDKRRFIEWLGPIVVETYGGTEGGGTRVSSEEWLERPGTVGRAWPGAEIHVLDDDGNPCPPGVEGMVYIRPTSPAFAYHKDPAKTAAAKAGALHTLGDLGWLDDDGYLFLLGRRADLIISGGVNIYPAEIESVLLESPAVADAAVFGVPDPDWGEQVKALVVLNSGHSADEPQRDALLAHCATRLARFKVPRSIEFRIELPRTSAGKLYKRRLQDEYWPPAG